MRQVFSGDQLNGQKTSYDTRSVLAKFARPVINRRIPWAAVFGEFLMSLHYFLEAARPS